MVLKKKKINSVHIKKITLIKYIYLRLKILGYIDQVNVGTSQTLKKKHVKEFGGQVKSIQKTKSHGCN